MRGSQCSVVQLRNVLLNTQHNEKINYQNKLLNPHITTQIHIIKIFLKNPKSDLNKNVVGYDFHRLVSMGEKKYFFFINVCYKILLVINKTNLQV